MSPPETPELLAQALRRSSNWTWVSGMLIVYGNGRRALYRGVVDGPGEALPVLKHDATAGCLMGLLAETGPGWQAVLTEEMARGGDWRLAVARALWRQWR
ncbi:MAG: hypothetical protein H6739_20885 [Alphaproteobacteria bacterium]|nr:hypothetical protein [Alphaproteobacteria bacterium]